MADVKMRRNKFEGNCVVCGKHVIEDAGYIRLAAADGSKSKPEWEVLCEAHGPTSTERNAKGKTGELWGLSVRDTWVRIFSENEVKASTGNADNMPMTDLQISWFMVAEFPNAPKASKSVERVRMYRNCFNQGTHAFASLGVPDITSCEYDDNGNPVNGSRKRRKRDTSERTVEPTQTASGMTEDDVRELVRDIVGSGVGEDELRKIVRSELENRPIVNITFTAKKVAKVDTAGKHKMLPDILRRVAAGLPVLMVGPTGSGKTHLARQVAEVLGADFTFNSMSAGVSESALFGRVVPNSKGAWQYKRSPFVQSYVDGGVHLLDEIDASDPNLLVAINAAIANGEMSLPFAQVEPIKRHEDSIIIAAANTFGTGASREYVGRNALDAATLNRFAMGTIEIDYDQDLESAIASAIIGGDAAINLCTWAWSVREAIDAGGMRRTMSTRNIEDAAKLLTVGANMEDVRNAYFTGWSSDDRRRAGN